MSLGHTHLREKERFIYYKKENIKMLDKMPVLVIFMVVIFLITSLMTFIAMENLVVNSPKVEPKKEVNSNVFITIVEPAAENTVENNPSG